MRSRSAGRHRLELVRRADEEDVREVERQVQVVVAEGRVLLRVEHLQHRARRVAAEVGAHLVDLVDHQHRVARAGVAHRADDRARASRRCRCAGGRGSRTRRARRPRRCARRSARACPPPSGRARSCPRPAAHEAEDRRARVGLQLAHREELEDAVLHQLDVVVVAIEVLARRLEVERVLAEARPGKRGEPLEVGADHPVLHRLRRAGARSAAARARPALRACSGSPASSSCSRSSCGLGLRLVHLAELLLDRLELLAQPVLALPAVHLRLHLGLDAGADLHELELAGEHLREHPQPARHVALLEELLLLLGLDPQRARDHVRELRRVVEVRDRDLELLRQVGHLLDDPREGRLHVAVERLELGRGLDLVRRLLDAGDHVGLGGHELLDHHALGAVHEDPQRAVRHLEHPRDHAGHAHAVHVVRARAPRSPGPCSPPSRASGSRRARRSRA